MQRYYSNTSGHPSHLQSEKNSNSTANNIACAPVARQAWVESMSETSPASKVGLIELNPAVFAVIPRIDLIHRNVKWQNTYKVVDHSWAPTRAEIAGGTKKPWPQKGTGRAQQKDNRGPHWKKGGLAWGPRGPRSRFYMLDTNVRIRGLTSMLSAKLAQDDLHIVESLDIPCDDGTYLEALAADRNWGISVLYIDDDDIMPRNIASAAYNTNGHTLMPLYGLNVYSMLKHETLVITKSAVRLLEERIVKSLNRLEFGPPKSTYDVPNPRGPVLRSNTRTRRWAHNMKTGDWEYGKKKIVDLQIVLDEDKCH